MKKFKGVIKLTKPNKEVDLLLTKEKNGYAVIARCPIHNELAVLGFELNLDDAVAAFSAIDKQVRYESKNAVQATIFSM